MHLVGATENILSALLLCLVVHGEAIEALRSDLRLLLLLFSFLLDHRAGSGTCPFTTSFAALRGTSRTRLLTLGKFLGHASVDIAATFLDGDAGIVLDALVIAHLMNQWVLC